MFKAIFRTLREVWGEPGGRFLVVGAAAIVAAGTAFYSVIEGWSVVDSLYFTVITLTTIGYGDLTPTTDAAKIFTVFFVIIGVSFLLGFLNFIIGRTVRDRVERLQEEP